MGVSERFHQACKALDLKAAPVAEQLKITRSTFYNYTNGSVDNIPVDVCVSFLRLYPIINRDWFFFGIGEMYGEQAYKIDQVADPSAEHGFKEKYLDAIEKVSLLQDKLINCLEKISTPPTPSRTGAH